MVTDLKPQPCVRSGLCCKKAICGWGEPGADGGCKYLLTKFKGDGYEFFECGRHDWIIQQPGAETMPAFDRGCCMAMFNSLRIANIKALVDEKINIRDVVSQNWFKQ